MVSSSEATTHTHRAAVTLASISTALHGFEFSIK